MDPEKTEAAPDNSFCPECGAAENGFFCRACGTLLRGGEMILCPRCRHIVPEGDFCNQCGQSLSGIALNLQQLVLAGDDFWVTPSTPPPASIESSLLSPDESVILEDAQLPDWLPVPAEVEARIHPVLRPIETERDTRQRNTFFTAAILLGFMLMLGLVSLTLFFLLGSGG